MGWDGMLGMVPVNGSEYLSVSLFLEGFPLLSTRSELKRGDESASSSIIRVR